MHIIVFSIASVNFAQAHAITKCVKFLWVRGDTTGSVLYDTVQKIIMMDTMRLKTIYVVIKDSRAYICAVKGHSKSILYAFKNPVTLSEHINRVRNECKDDGKAVVFHRPPHDRIRMFITTFKLAHECHEIPDKFMIVRSIYVRI